MREGRENREVVSSETHSWHEDGQRQQAAALAGEDGGRAGTVSVTYKFSCSIRSSRTQLACLQKPLTLVITAIDMEHDKLADRGKALHPRTVITSRTILRSHARRR